MDDSEPLRSELSGCNFAEAEATIELEYAMLLPRSPQMLDHFNGIADWDEIYETGMGFPSKSTRNCKDPTSGVTSQVAPNS